MSELVKKKLEDHWNKAAKEYCEIRDRYRKLEDEFHKSRKRLADAKQEYLSFVDREQGVEVGHEND